MDQEGVLIINLNLGCGDDTKGDVRIDTNYERQGANILADAHNIPIRNKIFGNTLLKSVLEHVDSPIKVILEIKRVTKKDIIIIVPNIMNIYRIIRTLKNPMYKINNNTRHLQGWDSKSIRHLAYRTNLKVIGIRYANIHHLRHVSHISLLFSGHMIATLRREF